MIEAYYLEVDAGVRYWEDASLNGKEDAEGKIPLRVGDRWRPVIDLATGRILDWPAGNTAEIHYKVCDDGEYWLLDSGRRRIAQWKGSYVPNDFLCVGDEGYGDYIILKIDETGMIQDWKMPRTNLEHWEPLNPKTEWLPKSP